VCTPDTSRSQADMLSAALQHAPDPDTHTAHRV